LEFLALRDAITAIAVIVILLLAAALAAPSLVVWDNQRAEIDAQVSRILGLASRTQGPIGVQLLPTPRLRLTTLFVGGEDADDPTARLDDVSIEVALLPLLSRDVRVTEASAKRADVTMIVRQDGQLAWPVPAVSTVLDHGWRVAIERVSVRDGSLRVVRAGTAGAKVFSPVVLEAAGDEITGPWRISGQVAGAAMQVTTGERDAQGRIRLKGYVGGGHTPRADFDGVVGNTIDGQIKLTFGPPYQVLSAGMPVGLVMSGRATGDWQSIALADISVDAAEGNAAMRLTGKGHVMLSPQARAVLSLSSDLIDANAWALSPWARSLGEQTAWRVPLPTPLPIDADIVVNQITLGNDDIRQLSLGLLLEHDATTVKHISSILPGDTRLIFAGAGQISADPKLEGRIDARIAAPRRLVGWLESMGFSTPNIPAPSAGTADAGMTLLADIAATRQYVGVRNVELEFGGGKVSGAGRYSPPESATQRGRFDAQVSAIGLDLARLPSLEGWRQRAADIDIGLALDARDLKVSTQGVINPPVTGNLGAGRARARISIDAAGTVLDSLDIDDLAGFDARLSGRLPASSAGTISGTIAARRLDPVIALAARLIGLEAMVSQLPAQLREAPVGGNLKLVAGQGGHNGAQRAAVPVDLIFDGQSGKTKLDFTAAFAPDTAQVQQLEKARLSLASHEGAPVTRGWPNRFVLEVKPEGLGQIALSGRADGDGVSIMTRDSMLFDQASGKTRAALISVNVADLSPWLSALAMPEMVLGADKSVDMSFGVNLSGPILALRPKGKIAGIRVDAAVDLDLPSRAMSGHVSLDELSLSSLMMPVLGVPGTPEAGRLWPTTRFASEVDFPLRGDVDLSIFRLDLGAGQVANRASTRLVFSGDGMSLRNAKGQLGASQLSGGLSLSRQGGRVSLTSDMILDDAFTGLPSGLNAIASGRLALNLRVGASGESPAALVANLSGAGQGTWQALAFPRLSPDAPARAVAAATLSGALPSLGALESQLGEAFAAGAFTPSGQDTIPVPVSVNGGVIKFGPVQATSSDGHLTLQADIDLRVAALSARANIRSATIPQGWAGSAPQAAVSWDGPVAAPARKLDALSLLNGLASISLTRELDRIDMFEQDARERVFFSRRLRNERERARLGEAGQLLQ
jgi:AsmA family